MQIKIGDAVNHQNYPIGTVKAIRRNLTNGEQTGIVQLHGYAEEGLESIPMAELTIDKTRRPAGGANHGR